MNEKKNPRRHCMIVHAYYPHDETRVEREAQVLLQNGYEVDVICLQHSPAEPASETAGGMTIHRLPVRRDKSRGMLGQLFEYLSFFTLALFKAAALHGKRKYSVVETHNLPDFLVFAALWPKLTGARVIHNIHDVMPEFYAARFEAGMDSWPVRLVRWQESLSCRFADHVITVTEAWRQALIERGLPARKVSVVMNIADGRVFDGGSVQRASRGNERFELIYHGTLAHRYGVDLLLEAVSRLREDIPNLHLTVHGRGEYLQNLLELARSLRLNGQVTFSTALLPVADLPSFIAQADLGIVPYRRDVFTDGILPTKLMEYTALHVPVIAARTPAIEAYFDENMVQYFPAGDVTALSDAIVHLYINRMRLRQLSTESNRFNEKYSWANIAREYVELVDRLSA